MEIKIRDTRIKEKFVIDDAYLNGYAKLCGIYATGVYCSLCRHSNYATQECWPEMRTIAEELAISRPSVIRAIEALESWNIIKVVKEKNDQGRQKNNVYILLDKSEWKPKPTVRVSDVDTESRVNVGTEPGKPQNKSRVSDVDHKDTHINAMYQIEGIATPNVAGRSDQDIVDILNAFKVVNSAYGKYFGNKTQRLSAARLAKVHGKDEVLQVIAFLEATNQQKFAPHIYTAVELENNWDRLKDFCITGSKPKKTLIV